MLPPDSPVWERAADAGADPDDDGSLILARTVSAEGRSRAFLGGRSVPVGVVAELAEGLLAVHGQTDQLRLSRPAEQRRALDRYAGAGAPRRCSSATARPTSAGGSSPPTSTAAAARPASWPRPPTSSGTGSRRSRPSRPSPGRTTPSTPRPSGSADADALRAAADEARVALVGDVTGDLGGGDLPAGRHRGPGHRPAGARRLRRPHPGAAGPGPRRRRRRGLRRRRPAGRLRRRPGRRPGPAGRGARPARGDHRAGPQVRRRRARALAGVLAWAEDAARRLSELDVSDEALDALAAARDAARAEVDDAGRRRSRPAGGPPPTGSPPRSARSWPGWR